MITAAEARQNVEIRKEEEIRKVRGKINKILESISYGIEFHSKSGITRVDFCPYDKSRFPSYNELEITAKLIEEELTKNGFKVLRNSWSDNVLTIQW